MEKVFLPIFEERNNVFVREFRNININIRHMTKSIFGYQESGRLKLTHIFVLKICFFTSTRGNSELRYFPLCFLFTYPLVATDVSILFLFHILENIMINIYQVSMLLIHLCGERMLFLSLPFPVSQERKS